MVGLTSVNSYLLIGGVLSLLASLAHLGIIMVGAKWYRLFGAGEQFAKAAEEGRAYPGIITFGIALVLALWGLYAFSGAGLITKLPFLKPALCVITAIYLVRGIGGFSLLLLRSQYTRRFIIMSSAVCTLFGLIHLEGLVQVWSAL